MKPKRITLKREESKRQIASALGSFQFAFSASWLSGLYTHLFGERFGGYRQMGLRRYEDVLRGDSCRYADKGEIARRVDEIFAEAKRRDESLRHSGDAPTQVDIIDAAISLIAPLWITHPFIDGNTRLCATVLILYLRTWGMELDDTMFARYPMTFRNSLVRATCDEATANKQPLRLFIEKALNGDKNFSIVTRMCSSALHKRNEGVSQP